MLHIVSIYISNVVHSVLNRFCIANYVILESIKVYSIHK